jgi:hypothetical protein
MVPLTPKPIVEAEELLGADTPDFSTDELANKVLVHGEAAAAPAGRADNFSWPHQDIMSARWNTKIATTELSDHAQSRFERSKACRRLSNKGGSQYRRIPFLARLVNQGAVQLNHNDGSHISRAIDRGIPNRQIVSH